MTTNFVTGNETTAVFSLGDLKCEKIARSENIKGDFREVRNSDERVALIISGGFS